MKNFAYLIFLILLFNLFHFECSQTTANNSLFGSDGVPDYYEAPDSNKNFDDDVTFAIFKQYNKAIRPVKQLVFTLKTSIRQIVSLDEKNQIMTSNIYIQGIWIDKRLRWDPLTVVNGNYIFGKLYEITIPASNVWLPDLFIINTASSSGYIPITSSNLVLVDYQGHVFLDVSVTNLQTRCKMNVYYL
jgi:hypothetical protein